MSGGGFDRLEALFHELDPLDAASRAARLEALREEDAALAAELEALLATDGALTRRELGLDQWALASRAWVDTAPGDPQQVGPYRLIRLLGAGGMGRVYEARQEQPVQRSVALKLTRRGLDSEEAQARFLLERQALAALEHPNIARVFDAGSDEQGRPWFAMELVDGVPITRWAADQQLGLRERIALFLPVCDAVQHAHQKGVLHRDLKPSNILVLPEPGRGSGQPKVIDFGLAKRIDATGAAEPGATRAGELLGTPEYMSPEQASLGEVDVDTRSDVYALGLVLYELLVGELPFAGGLLRSLAFHEMCRRIREDKPPGPSTHLARLDSGTHPSWRRSLRGDLDSVLLKALSKDREQRYGSAAALAEDLRRYLNDEPVLAQRPSLRYRTGKFLRRHRYMAGTAAVMLLAVLAGTALALAGLLEARRAEARALAAAADAREAQQVSEQVTRFLVDLFDAASPQTSPGADPGARELLARGEARIETLDAAPAARARLLEVLGEVYWALGDYDRAEPLLRRGVEARDQGGQADPLRESALLDRLGGLLRDRGDPAAAETPYLQALERLAPLSGQDAELHRVRTLNNLAVMFSRSGRLDDAATHFQQAIAITEALPVLDDEASLGARARLPNLRANLAAVEHRRGNFEQARDATRRALAEALEQIPEQHPFIAGMRGNLARALLNLGELHQARREAQRGVDIEAQVLDADHPTRAQNLMLLAQIDTALGQAAPALEALDLARGIVLGRLGAQAPLLRSIEYSRAQALRLAGDARQAVDLWRDELPQHLEPTIASAGARRHLALAQRQSGDGEAASQSAREALDHALLAAAETERDLACLLLELLALDAAPGAQPPPPGLRAAGPADGSHARRCPDEPARSAMAGPPRACGRRHRSAGRGDQQPPLDPRHARRIGPCAAAWTSPLASAAAGARRTHRQGSSRRGRLIQAQGQREGSAGLRRSSADSTDRARSKG